MTDPGLASGPFIVATSLEKPDPETRKLIRSHVMRGKNTRKSKRTKELRQQGEPVALDDSLRCQGPRADGDHCEEQEWALVSPHKVASELSLFGYVDEMKPYMLNLIHRAFTIVKPSTYTLELALTDSATDVFCFSNLSQHPALLHSVLFTAQAFSDLSLGLPYGKIAQAHLAKTLYHLQQSVQNSDEATTSSTMVVVLSLATAAALLGDVQSAATHMKGLHRMIELRGGLKTISKGGMLEHKTQRLDFGLAIATGCDLRFVQDDVSWGPQIARGISVTRLTELSMIQPRPDPRLLNIWVDLRVFSNSANEATRTGVKMSEAFFSRLNTSVPPRLIGLRFDPTSLSELLRLCMLAFMKSLLVNINGLGPKLTFIANGLKDAILAQQFPPAPEQAKFLLWALFVSSISIFENYEQEWLRAAMVQTASVLSLRTWAETRMVLKSFLWIDMVYNRPGKLLFEQWLENPVTEMETNATA
ncbi:hypothetical protein QQZ08_000088 [Neonectria magnoliae]|uniref:Uncharacterized protein n=1 Tax=Neonectria magnoliae TaxID=2732573 RepID=A0ABR1IKW5_9HYPO